MIRRRGMAEVRPCLVMVHAYHASHDSHPLAGRSSRVIQRPDSGGGGQEQALSCDAAVKKNLKAREVMMWSACKEKAVEFSCVRRSSLQG